MKKLILIIFLLFYSLPSVGSVNGKGVICKCLDCKLEHLDSSSYMPNKIPTEIGFHFKTNKVAIYYITKIGDDIKVSENIQTTLRKKKRFLSDDNEIQWTYKDSLNIYAYSLDRNSLILSKKNITKTKTYNRRKCESYSETEFFKNMNKLSENYQILFNNTPKKNKI